MNNNESVIVDVLNGVYITTISIQYMMHAQKPRTGTLNEKN